MKVERGNLFKEGGEKKPIEGRWREETYSRKVERGNLFKEGGERKPIEGR